MEIAESCNKRKRSCYRAQAMNDDNFGNPDLSSSDSSNDDNFDNFDVHDVIGPTSIEPETSTVGHTGRRSKQSRTTDASSPATPRVDLSLIEVIKSKGNLISQAVKLWVQRYEKNPKSAMVEILMMLFEACGVKFHLNEDSLDETDVEDVVSTLVELACKGEVEDYYYRSQQEERKKFTENLTSFWDKFVIECQNGPLFDKILFEKCMNYVVALSCSRPLVYHQIASLVGLQLVTSFITVSKTLSVQQETIQRQLNAEKKNGEKGPLVESLNKRLSMICENITLMEDMMRKLSRVFLDMYRDADVEIRMASITSLGLWILSFPSLFLQDLYLRYLGWTLNDKKADVRKCSVLALQKLYELDDNVPSLGLFTARFSNRMIELADDIDTSVAVCTIGLLKQLLRHRLLSNDDLGPVYDLLFVERLEIRYAIGSIIYDNFIAQKYSISGAGLKGGDTSISLFQLGNVLQMLTEFFTDPILIVYVVDAVWDHMHAMKDWKCIISMLLNENPQIELTDTDATNLIRLLLASVMKAVGEGILPTTDSQKQCHTKAQKETFEDNRRDVTISMTKSYPQLLLKFMADREKIKLLVEIFVHLKLELYYSVKRQECLSFYSRDVTLISMDYNLNYKPIYLFFFGLQPQLPAYFLVHLKHELYSLKRQERNFRIVLELIKEACFKHDDKDLFRSCINTFVFCCTNSQGVLQDLARNKLKELEDDLTAKLKSAMIEVRV